MESCLQVRIVSAKFKIGIHLADIAMSHFFSWGVQLESNTVVDFSLDGTSSFCCMADHLSSSFTRKEKQLYRPTC